VNARPVGQTVTAIYRVIWSPFFGASDSGTLFPARSPVTNLHSGWGVFPCVFGDVQLYYRREALEKARSLGSFMSHGAETKAAWVGRSCLSLGGVCKRSLGVEVAQAQP
jgi:hypothetical protein